MSCSISGEKACATFQQMADNLSNCTERIRNACSARVSAKTAGIALIVIGVLIATAGIIIAAVVNCLSAGLILAMVGAALAGLGIAQLCSRRTELERQLANIVNRIEFLKGEYEALQEIYNANCEARRTAGKHCQELEKSIDDLCRKNAETIKILEQDAQQEKERSLRVFKESLEQSQSTCSRLTEERNLLAEELCRMADKYCKLEQQNSELKQQIQQQQASPKS
ncbi:hypothetical protein [Chlamydia sp.]|uniref:hypothetical protein n=1 Tax=Chlamydia sp. TaxID=35827 RepID=UPI0025C57C4F|nr:hypothetical protein [Chlamydia sp.]MBQ8499051.1 hypothetical protein [Chlamydia sp.]